MSGRRGRSSRQLPTGNDLVEPADKKMKTASRKKRDRTPSSSSSETTPPRGRRSHSAAPGPSSKPPPKRRTPAPPNDPAPVPPNRQIYGDPKGHGPDPHGFEALIGHISSPIPIRAPEYVTVNSSDLTTYFARMRTVLSELLYPGAEGMPAGVITEPQFVSVCRYLTKARVDTVHFKFSGLRTEGRLPLPMEVIVPQALADIINGIGMCVINNGGKVVIPQPEPIGADIAARLANQVTHAIFTNFSIFVNSAISRGFIRGSTILGTVEGAAWWLLSCRSTADLRPADGNTNNVVIQSIFNEFTPRDTIHSAIVQNRFNGEVPNHTQMEWSSSAIRGALALRTGFIINA